MSKTKISKKEIEKARQQLDNMKKSSVFVTGMTTEPKSNTKLETSYTTDIFGRESLKIMQEHPITISFGKDTTSTTIKTSDGHQIQGVTNLKVELDADTGCLSATLTILNPKIETQE